MVHFRASALACNDNLSRHPGLVRIKPVRGQPLRSTLTGTSSTIAFSMVLTISGYKLIYLLLRELQIQAHRAPVRACGVLYPPSFEQTVPM